MVVNHTPLSLLFPDMAIAKAYVSFWVEKGQLREYWKDRLVWKGANEFGI